MGFNYLNYIAVLGAIDRLFDLHTGGSRRPVFFDVEATCPALRTLEADAPAIREELVALMAEKAAIPRYHDLDRRSSRSRGG